MAKIKTIISMIDPTPRIRAMLGEIADVADVTFVPAGEAIDAYLPQAEVVYGQIAPDVYALAKKLRWLQTNSTGVDQMMFPAFVQSDVILTNTGRSITNIVAGHALAMLYALARNLHHQRDLMRQRQWKIVCGRDIGEMTLGILGFGKIGSAIAMRARPMVESIYALDMCVPATDTLDRGYTFDSLDELLGVCDAIICSLPLTSTTHRLIGREQFELMRRDAYFINISRGEIVDEAALLAALREGEIAGAGIDVLEREPCPPDSELWDEPNLLLTPHSAGYCERLQERKMRQFIENFMEYASTGRISMALDKGRGW